MLVRLREVMLRRRRNRDAAGAVNRACATLCAAVVVALELRFGVVRAALFGVDGDGGGARLYFLLLSLLLSLLLGDAAFDLWTWSASVFLLENPLGLNKKQMRLLRVQEGEPGFKVTPDATVPKHPNPFSPPLEGSFVLPPPSAASTTVLSSPGDGASSINSSSWVFQRSPPLAASPASPEQRRSVFNSSVGPISDEDSLMEYLDEYDAWERRRNSLILTEQRQSPDTTAQSFWRPQSAQQPGSPSVQDYSPALNRLSYQLSTPMPGDKTKGSESGDVGIRARGKREDICYRYGKK